MRTNTAKIVEEQIKKSNKDTSTIINETNTEELIIALCGQLGTNINKINDQLSKLLKEDFGYEVQEIKLSKYISKYSSYNLENTKSKGERITSGIEGGNELRNKHGNSILAQLAIREIALDRSEQTKDQDAEKQTFRSRRKCYIINSLKHPDELNLLKQIYRNIFYTIGIFSKIKLRETNLKREGLKIPEIYSLIDRDSGEDKSFGQGVEKTFIKSDYFLRISSENIKDIKPKIERFLNLIFDNEILTPTIEETAMYQAAAAATNSACLSRQVGAAITDRDGKILSLGWNDVPKFGGDLYNSSCEIDNRCYNFNNQKCVNEENKIKISRNIASNLVENGLIKKEQLDLVKDSILDNGINRLIEFARSIHAEMHAIIQGSQKTGDKMVGGNLFCTTYPCHNCARHILVAGIKKVYYIEPYKKSLGTILHSDAIVEDVEQSDDKLQILMYEGVAPVRFIDFYKMTNDNRKQKLKKEQELISLKPKHTLTLRAIHQLESIVTNELKDKELDNL